MLSKNARFDCQCWAIKSGKVSLLGNTDPCPKISYTNIFDQITHVDSADSDHTGTDGPDYNAGLH